MSLAYSATVAIDLRYVIGVADMFHDMWNTFKWADSVSILIFFSVAQKWLYKIFLNETGDIPSMKHFLYAAKTIISQGDHQK